MQDSSEQVAEGWDVQIHPLVVEVKFPESFVEDQFERFNDGYMHLEFEEADLLRNLLNEAWLNRKGLQPVSVQAQELQPGDIIPSLGLRVLSIGDTGGRTVYVYCYSDHTLYLGRQLEITVHRNIL